MTKQELREFYIHKKIELSEEQKFKADEIIFNKLVNLDLFKNSDCILTYVSTRIEVDTKSVIEYALMKGKTVAVPRCDKNSNYMKYYRISSLNDLEKGNFNILEPTVFCSEVVDIQNGLCIVPGLAFDKKGHRLGYGRGYFDRFLSENSVKTVGLCYKDFLVDDLPVEGFDIAVDKVLTD
ncbi:MAG: 5-formyltetrahydrofolate cyclo-ligase [Clostridia bacterium]|nr:5-formyltetrahydrofolate cyclo-ligase [Clostridia bacterium]